MTSVQLPFCFLLMHCFLKSFNQLEKQSGNCCIAYIKINMIFIKKTVISFYIIIFYKLSKFNTVRTIGCRINIPTRYCSYKITLSGSYIEIWYNRF